MSCTSSRATRATGSSRACRIPTVPHFSAFSYEACDAAFRDGELFASHAAEESIDTSQPGVFNSILAMGGTQHRRYRALVQPSFVPAKAQWWINNWIEQTVHALIDQFVDDGHAELNVDFAAAIPVLTITGSFGVDVEQALVIREFLMSDTPRVFGILEPIIAARREQPADDLISVLVEAEYTDEDGVDHRLTDAEILSFSMLLMAAGSGTTWKQMGITLAAILERPDVLAAVRADRAAVRAAIEESVRWMPTDPMFSRHVTRDTEFFGVHLPEGSVLHLCLGAANRDPARWERADEFDITRAAEAVARVRQRSARVPRHARRPRGDERGDHRAARPPAEPAARSRRRAPELHRLLRTGRHRDPRRLRLRSTQ